MMKVMRHNVAQMREEYEYLCEHVDTMPAEEAQQSLYDMMEKTKRIEGRLKIYERELNLDTSDSTDALPE